MPGKVIVPAMRLKVLENAALVAFPYKIQSVVFGDTGNGYFRAGDIYFWPPLDQKALENSDTFEKYEKGCEKDTFFDVLVNEIRKNRERFGTFKECQKRRRFDECEKDLPDSDCDGCEQYGSDPGIMGLYDIPAPGDAFPDGRFFMGWHAHPTSVYGPPEKLAKPCDGDSLAVRRILMNQKRIVGELITAVSETGQVLTRAYNPPKGLKISDSLDRTEVPIEIE